MADLKPHPLVTSVALKLAQLDVGTLRKVATDELRTRLPTALRTAIEQDESPQQGDEAAAAAQLSTAWQDLTAGEIDDAVRYATRAQSDALAVAYANQQTTPALSLLAGYLGGRVEHDEGFWYLLYLDARLCDWMLVPEGDLIANERLKDDNAPHGVRDVLWVRSTANVVTGTGARPNDGRFLVGTLTRAGDFASSTPGGTFSAASGLICETTTPPCCYATRTRC
jgi:hypothetical protein